MQHLLLTIFAVFFFLGGAAGQVLTNAKSGNDIQKIDGYLRNWEQSSDYLEFKADPNILAKLIEPKKLEEFEEVPDWIKNFLVTDAKQTERLNKRLDLVYKVFPEGRKINVVYFQNDYPFFALGNRSLLFVSTATMEMLDKEEFAAATFHEFGHLIFAQYYWNLRRAGNAELVKQIELNCDLIAYHFLQKADIKTKNLEKTLKKLDDLEKSSGNRDQVELQFYPTLDERLANLKAHALRYKSDNDKVAGK